MSTAFAAVRTISSSIDPPSQSTEDGCRALMGLIGEIPHPLVSARSPLREKISLRGFAQGCRVPRSWEVGFPEFTRFFSPGHPGKLLFLRGKQTTQCPQPHALPLSYRGILQRIHQDISIQNAGAKINAHCFGAGSGEQARPKRPTSEPPAPPASQGDDRKGPPSPRRFRPAWRSSRR